MYSPDKNSAFWQYLSAGQKGLIEEGLYILGLTKDHPDTNIADYSYLVFPFAKAYEGFLKQLFLDLEFISKAEYESDRFRIGKALNPYLEKRLQQYSIYNKVVYLLGNHELADELWRVWKTGRNLIFHYFPHNLKALSLKEAESVISDILNVMQRAVIECKVR